MANQPIFRALLLTALAMVSTWASALAAGPPNTYPGGAVSPDGQWHVITGNTSLWYLFDYAGDRSKIEINLQDGFNNRLEFRFYTPEQIQLPDGFSDTPIGRGSPQYLNCDQGKCPTGDLIWAGDFFSDGTYYVQVFNPNPEDKPYQLQITGSGVSMHPPAPPLAASYTGQVLVIPYPPSPYYGQFPAAYGCYYWVRYRDTLFSIARRYGITVWQLARANGIYNPNLIWTGQRLYIPTCR